MWLWFFRREIRFPRALLLIPCALACAFLLNVVRIAALILIGNAGAPEVAFVGFHSQAGWIAFTLVALGFSVLATMYRRRVMLTRRTAVPGPGDADSTAVPAKNDGLAPPWSSTGLVKVNCLNCSGETSPRSSNS